jgi:ABC-type multidrug transport system ATPase subunit
MTTAPMFGCQGIHHAYGAQHVLEGLDLTAEPGRVYGLVGRNGAGKSTALRIMLGLLRPASGVAYLMGRPFDRASLAHVGASIDGPALYNHLSAEENLLVHARLLKLPRRDILDVLTATGLSGTGTKKVRAFSTGMRARLALAIALLGQPEVLILDEPQNGLDPEGIIELRLHLRALAAQGRTVLVSSHQLGELLHLADDIGVLAGGRLVYEGPLAEFAPTGDLERAYLMSTAGA